MAANESAIREAPPRWCGTRGGLIFAPFTEARAEKSGKAAGPRPPNSFEKTDRKEDGVAKKSQVNRDNKRQALIAKYAERRAELRKQLNDPNVSVEEKLKVQEAFAKMPRNSCPTRLNHRCGVSGRSKAYYRKFGISRIALRELALAGQLPGVRKSSW